MKTREDALRFENYGMGSIMDYHKIKFKEFPK